MNQINFLPFLEKVLTSNSLTEEIRQNALHLRDQIKYENVTRNCFPFQYKHITVEECDINNCVAKTLYSKNEVLGGPIKGLSKISFIKNLREFYNIGLGEAKDLAEILERKEEVKFSWI